MTTPTYTPKICNKPTTIKKIRSVAIKAYCTDCSAGNRTEVKDCICTECPLYPFRGYINFEGEKRVMTEEQRAEAGERFRQARESKSRSI